MIFNVVGRESRFHCDFQGQSELNIEGGGNWFFSVKNAKNSILIPRADYEVDIFVCGGGGAGGSSEPFDYDFRKRPKNSAIRFGAGGGGGYYETVRNVKLLRGKRYYLTVGNGGVGARYGYTQGDGGSSAVLDDNGVIVRANGGKAGQHGSYTSNIDSTPATGRGGEGGSGGGDGSYIQLTPDGILYNLPSSYCHGGSNGSSGSIWENIGAKGSGKIAYAFEEESYMNGVLYGGGGGGGFTFKTENESYVNKPELFKSGGKGGKTGGGNGARYLIVSKYFDGVNKTDFFTKYEAAENGVNGTGGGGGGNVSYYDDDGNIVSGISGNGGSGIIIIRNARG